MCKQRQGCPACVRSPHRHASTLHTSTQAPQKQAHPCCGGRGGTSSATNCLPLAGRNDLSWAACRNNRCERHRKQIGARGPARCTWRVGKACGSTNTLRSRMPQSSRRLQTSRRQQAAGCRLSLDSRQPDRLSVDSRPAQQVAPGQQAAQTQAGNPPGASGCAPRAATAPRGPHPAGEQIKEAKMSSMQLDWQHLEAAPRVPHPAGHMMTKFGQTPTMYVQPLSFASTMPCSANTISHSNNEADKQANLPAAGRCRRTPADFKPSQPSFNKFSGRVSDEESLPAAGRCRTTPARWSDPPSCRRGTLHSVDIIRENSAGGMLLHVFHWLHVQP